MYTPFFLARRSMRSRPGRTLLTLLGIVLGVAVVLAIQVTNTTTIDSLRQVFDRAAGQAALIVVSPNPVEQPLDEDVLSRVERSPGVLAAAPSLRARTLLAADASGWQIGFSMTGIAEGSFFQLYGIDPGLDPQVRVYILSAGRMPRPGTYEAVLPESTAQSKHLSIGQDLVFLTPDGRPERLEIVGLLSADGVALINDGVVAFAPIDVVQDIFDRSGEIDEIALLLETGLVDNPARLDMFKTMLTERLDGDAEAVYPASRGQLVSQMMATYQLGLTFFSLIAIFVGGFLIYNAFSMTVVERTREIGMMRAVGMNRRQVLAMVLAEAMLLSLVGSVLGLVLGYGLALGLVQLLGDLVVEQQSAINLTAVQLILSAAVGLVCTLVAAVIPAVQAARISPLDALRQRSGALSKPHHWLWLGGLALMGFGLVATFQVTWSDELLFLAGNVSLGCYFLGATLTVGLAVHFLEHLTRPLVARLYGQEGAIGSANVRRAIGRTTLTVASLMVALTMIISIESLAYSFEVDLKHWIDNALGGDLYVRAPLPMRESFGLRLEAVPGVEAVAPARILDVRAVPGTITSITGEVDENFYYEAFDPESFRRIAGMEFAANQGDPEAAWQRLEQGQAVFISASVADRYGLHQGDPVVLLTRRGEVPFTIAAEVTDFGGQGQVLYGTYADMRRFFNEQGADRFTVSVRDDASVDSVSQEILARFEATHHISIQTTASFKESILDLVDQSFSLFDVLNGIGIIIGALGVVNTLTMNVIERRREIGGLRSLGMTRGQVVRMVLSEALVMGLMGGMYGAWVGWMIAHVIIRGTNLMIGYDLQYRFTPDPFLIGASLSLLVVQLAALLPARRAASLNIVEAVVHE